LKIQDGCDRRCTYCRITLARGPSRSLGASAALERLRRLEAAGFGEAVLTGVNIGQYRDDFFHIGLGGLLKMLLEGTSAINLRLSSLDPQDFDAPLLEAIEKFQRVRPHFHLSVQSGSAHILRQMGRAYTPEAVEALAVRLRGLREDPFLACDLIAGFPGEGFAEFEDTLKLCRQVRWGWIHAFPYSRRPGTVAARLPGAAPSQEAARRVEALGTLAREGRAAYRDRWIGRPVEAVLEAGETAGHRRLRAANYLRLLLTDPLPPDLSSGAPLRCRLTAPAPPAADFDAYCVVV